MIAALRRGTAANLHAVCYLRRREIAVVSKWMHLGRMSDREPLIHNANVVPSALSNRQRALSSCSLDPYEDPVVGLERVASSPNDEERLRRQRRVQQPPPEEELERALSSKYESLNYEVSENQLYRDEEADPYHHNKNYNIWEIPLFLAVGVIGGLTGALFNHLNTRLTEFRKK
ncbi:hypothetical protein TELCIR_09711 [Teladorsagia circumcincta]|uniref:Uncharacterized protein n=1 Tax=Teladorsagia circumcincta TaxID=45464 RepID=A0A2G9UE38_TELCI|nr:hypothetical protein TELCIR_09711 [Teladorsagia circumcincta]